MLIIALYLNKNIFGKMLPLIILYKTYYYCIYSKKLPGNFLIRFFTCCYFLFYFYIYLPESQESDKGANIG